MTARLGYASAALAALLLVACAGEGEAPAEAPAAVPERSIAAPFERIDGPPEAPFASDQTARIKNYSRVAPYVATAGAPGTQGVRAAEAAGFALMIDLRRPEEEGVEEDIRAAREAGIARIALPMPAEAAAIPAFMDTLSAVLEDERRYPILLHCGSANRAGAAWALYRAKTGVPAAAAIEEGRAAGMTGREAMVRHLLGLPPQEGIAP